jgi:uncharacterized membrane protein
MFKQVKHPRFFAVPVLLVVAIVVLAACASQPVATPAPQSAAPVAVVPAQATSTGANVPTESVPGGSNPAAPANKGSVSFSKDLTPILQDSCVSCHGGEKTSKALDMKTFANLMAGSQNGAVIVAGDAANSPLIQSIQSGKMPKRGTKLTADQVQLFVDWVNAGAQNN